MYEMSPDVAKVKWLEGYRLDVTFANGEYGVFDCTPYMGYEFMQDLKSERAFSEAMADHGTIAWPNGADLCPDCVYAATVKSSGARGVA